MRAALNRELHEVCHRFQLAIEIVCRSIEVCGLAERLNRGVVPSHEPQHRPELAERFSRCSFVPDQACLVKRGTVCRMASPWANTSSA